MGAFADTVGIYDLHLIGAWQFAGLVLGAMIPYWFFAMTMESVGQAANKIVLEVRRQVNEKRRGQADSKQVLDYKSQGVDQIRESLQAALESGINENKTIGNVQELSNRVGELSQILKEKQEELEQAHGKAVGAANPDALETTDEQYEK